ncbi:CBS domain-containing protein [Aquabacterium olei]|uniref:CBS domain-containing protein n=1 Tax=Aquabacterium olei TaxID=1296669 RepID=A0A2U8FQF5_9BURK|nr:CBS domain-containing protein [Aquabacterium olei]AWI52644.1 CBS domain-containing protein [Aquabacterium olei]
MQRIADVMTRGVEVIAPDATLQMAAKMMDDLNVGALPVCDNRRLVGMITDRDITVRATASDLRPSEVRVSDIMTEHPRWCLESQTLEEVAQQMSDVQVRRIPVLDKDNALIGIVSLGDIAVREPEAVQDVLREISTPSEPDRPAAST